MAIQWIKNSFDILLPYDGDFALCSTFDPIREAQKWWELNQKHAEWCDCWIVLGGGGGFHLEYMDSKKIFGVVEYRWDHLPASVPKTRLANDSKIIIDWRQEIETYPHLRWGIFVFRPAWQNRTEDFSAAQKILNGQQPQSRFFKQLSEELFL